jgi:hypothetical protein
MLEVKLEHPISGANTAWIPSPTAATLRATHYHDVDVFERMDVIKKRQHASLDALLAPPVMTESNLIGDGFRYGLNSNCQTKLGNRLTRSIESRARSRHPTAYCASIQLRKRVMIASCSRMNMGSSTIDIHIRCRAKSHTSVTGSLGEHLSETLFWN